MVCANPNCPYCHSDPPIVSENANNFRVPLPRMSALVFPDPFKNDSILMLGGRQMSAILTLPTDCIWRYNYVHERWNLLKMENPPPGIDLNTIMLDSFGVCAPVPIRKTTKNVQKPIPIFFFAYFDHNKDMEDVNGYNHFYFIKQHPPPTNGNNRRDSHYGTFSFEELLFTDVDNSLVDMPSLDRAVVSVSVKVGECREEGENSRSNEHGHGGGEIEAIYFLTTTCPFSHQNKFRRCDFLHQLIRIFELRKCNGKNDGSSHWDWKCLTNYEINDRGAGAVFCNGIIVNQNALELMKRTLFRHEHLQCVLHKNYLYILTNNGRYVPEPAEVDLIEHRKIFAFDLDQHVFTVIDLQGNPTDGLFPFSRRPHTTLLNNGRLYLLPGVETGMNEHGTVAEQRFSSILWCLCLNSFTWHRLANWDMQMPCANYGAFAWKFQSDVQTEAAEEFIGIYGGVVVPRDFDQMFREDPVHPSGQTTFLNCFQFFKLPN